MEKSSTVGYVASQSVNFYLAHNFAGRIEGAFGELARAAYIPDNLESQ
jgi:hypothetical protein